MDPISLITGILGRVETIVDNHRQLTSVMTLVRINIEQTAHLFEMPSVQAVVPDLTKKRVEAILAEIAQTLDHIAAIVDRPLMTGRAYLVLGSVLSCFGAQPMTRKLKDLSDELKEIIDFTTLFLDANRTDAIHRQLNSGPRQRFRTESQKRFWEEACGNAAHVDYDTITGALALLELDPEIVCKHAALGILSGKDGVTPESASEAFGDMSPRAWMRSRKRGPSRTIAFAGHVDNVNFVYTAGDWMATCSDDRTLKVFKDFVMIHVMVGHERAVTACHINEARDKIFSVSDDQSVKAWNLNNGELLWTHKTGPGYPKGVTTSARQEVLYCCHESSVVVVLSDADGAPVNRILSKTGIVAEVYSCHPNVFIASKTGYVTAITDRNPLRPGLVAKTPFVQPAFSAVARGFFAVASAKKAGVWRFPTPGMTRAQLEEVAELERQGPHEVEFPHPVEQVHAARVLEIRGTVKLLVAWTFEKHRMCISEFPVPGGAASPTAAARVEASARSHRSLSSSGYWPHLAGFDSRTGPASPRSPASRLARPWDDLVRSANSATADEPRHTSVDLDPDTYITATCFDAHGNLYTGLENGSTHMLARAHNYETIKKVIGCRNNSSYFPEHESQGDEIVVSGIKDVVLIGPRRTPGANARQAAIIWNVRNGSVTEVMNQISGAVAHTPVNDTDLVWILCKQDGAKTWIERFGVNNHLTQKIQICDENMTPRFIHSMSEKYTVVQLVSETNLEKRIIVQDVAENKAWTLKNTNIVTCLAKKPVMIIEKDGELQYADFRDGFPPRIGWIGIKADQFNICHACDAGGDGIMILTDSEFLLVPDIFDEDNAVRTAPAPPEAVGVLKISDEKFITCGNYGRFFVYSFNPLKQIQTCVTHPSRTIYSQKTRNVLTWDSTGAILNVDLD